MHRCRKHGIPEEHHAKLPANGGENLSLVVSHLRLKATLTCNEAAQDGSLQLHGAATYATTSAERETRGILDAKTTGSDATGRGDREARNVATATAGEMVE